MSYYTNRRHNPPADVYAASTLIGQHTGKRAAPPPAGRPPCAAPTTNHQPEAAMNPKINPGNPSATELAKALNVRVWYWPRTENPYRVHTRLPGKPYRLHSAHATEIEAMAEFDRVAEPSRECFCTRVAVGEAAVAASTTL
jgi:hypothetical protein